MLTTNLNVANTSEIVFSFSRKRNAPRVQPAHVRNGASRLLSRKLFTRYGYSQRGLIVIASRENKLGGVRLRFEGGSMSLRRFAAAALLTLMVGAGTFTVPAAAADSGAKKLSTEARLQRLEDI